MTFGLTLAGGGARGAAHIGVLLELRRIGRKPDLITGTSIGSMVGGLYAAGMPLDELIAFFRDFSFGSLYKLPRKEQALISTGKLESLFEDAIGRPTFADLEIPLAVVATDLKTRSGVVIKDGDVITAILASSTIPVAMPAVEYGDKLLVDGGMANNVPFDVARELGADRVLAVDLSNTAPYGTKVEMPPTADGTVARGLGRLSKQKMWQVGFTVVDMMMAQLLELQIMKSGGPDVLLRPELGTLGFFDFHRLDEGIVAGRQAMIEADAEIKALFSIDD